MTDAVEKRLRFSTNSDSAFSARGRRRVMMGRQTSDQASLFYEFRLDERVPKNHLLRRINVFVAAVLGGARGQLKPYYSEIGRPSIDPDLMIRMLIVGYCYGLRSERKLTQEVELHLAYRWFCRLDLDDKVPHHSTFSENRLHRFRESDVFRHIFERVVAACMAAGLVKGEGFAVDASVMEANASRYHGKAPDEIEWAVAALTFPATPGNAAEAQTALGGKLVVCGVCHGVDGLPKLEGVPIIWGLQENYILKQLREFKNGARASDVMKKVAITLTEEELAPAAAYFATKNWPEPAKNA